jgi:hypothetical protein
MVGAFVRSGARFVPGTDNMPAGVIERLLRELELVKSARGKPADLLPF